MKIDTPDDAARAVLARCPDLALLGATDARGNQQVGGLLQGLGSLLAADADAAFGGDLSTAADVFVDHLQGRSGDLAGDPRRPEYVLRALETYRASRVWCWLARFEIARRAAYDAIMLRAENDGDAYIRGKDARWAIMGAWSDVSRARLAVLGGADPDDLGCEAALLDPSIRREDVCPDAIRDLQKRWDAGEP